MHGLCLPEQDKWVNQLHAPLDNLDSSLCCTSDIDSTGTEIHTCRIACETEIWGMEDLKEKTGEESKRDLPFKGQMPFFFLFFCSVYPSTVLILIVPAP